MFAKVLIALATVAAVSMASPLKRDETHTVNVSPSLSSNDNFERLQTDLSSWKNPSLSPTAYQQLWKR